MIAKEEITIKVPSEVAEAYRNATEEERLQIESRIAVLLKSSMTSSNSVGCVSTREPN